MHLSFREIDMHVSIRPNSEQASGPKPLKSQGSSLRQVGDETTHSVSKDGKHHASPDFRAASGTCPHPLRSARFCPDRKCSGPGPAFELVKKVDIPYESFKLSNGLTVLVHTDRKAPIIGVTTYYRVGSKHEPRGKTGFAHLYEHLFFGGSENVPNFDVPGGGRFDQHQWQHMVRSHQLCRNRADRGFAAGAFP
jgi:hypothetical protein